MDLFGSVVLMQQLAILLCIACFTSFSDAFVSRSSSVFGNTGIQASAVPSANVLHASPLASEELSIAERCYDAWNRRKMDDAAACFADDFTYDDGQYLGSINKRSEMERLFQRWAKALPPGAMVVIDHVAKCPTSGNIGTQWHVEKEDGSDVPFTRGCDFYTVEKKNGLIKTGFKVSEMIVKPSKQFSDALVSSTSNLMQATGRLSGAGNQKSELVEPTIESGSIIESYFEAWNRRDMESALDCFVDDCIYETEDPVFVGAFRGKEALREHLVRNVEVLPSACKIILDDLAIDPDSRTSGVKWHLEANGVSIPNLRGCSMYTMDEATGLLKSGFDVTEAPVKLPGVALDVLAAPFGKLLF